jgi:predicted DNA binding protein
MPRAELRITVPRAVWIGELSRSYPSARFRILAALSDDEAGVALLGITDDDVEAVLAEMRDDEAVVSVDVLRRGDRSALVQFETTSPLLLVAVQESGIPLEMPFDMVDGEVTWEVTAPRERLSRLGDSLTKLGVQFSVDAVHRDIDATQLLTDRQRWLLEEAAERGYYDTPRECTLTDLAEDLDMAKSTCSETLHRAEGKVLKQFLDEQEAEPLAAQ